jgi:hypothetical protein
MEMIVEQSMERGLAGETKVLEESLPDQDSIHTSHITCPRTEPGSL